MQNGRISPPALLLGRDGRGRRRGWQQGRCRWAGWHGRGSVGGAGGEGEVLGALLHLLHPAFLELQVGHDVLKGGVGQKGEVGRGIAEVLAEAGCERAEEKFVVDLGADVTQLISQLLEAAAVLINGLLVLMAVKKFLLQEDAALELVV